MSAPTLTKSFTSAVEQKTQIVKDYKAARDRGENYDIGSKFREINRKERTSDIVKDLGQYSTPPVRVNASIDTAGDTLGGIAAVASAASVFAPVAIPLAAATGIGYGVYRLGKTLHIW